MLGVVPTATKSEITKAYRTLAARYHPDRHQGNELEDLAREKLAQLNEAYETLSDPSRRAAYDAKRRGAAPDPFSQPFGGSQPARPPNIGRSLRSTILLLLLLGGAFFALRFIRNPRALPLVAIAIFLAWFGPRIFRLITRKK